MASLQVGQKIGIETDDGNSFQAQLKRIKGPLIGVSVISGLKNRSSIAAGKPIKINVNGTGKEKIQAVVKQDKAFPLLILSLETSGRILNKEERALEEEDIEEIIAGVSDPEYVAQRDSARSEDSFPIEFYKQSPERVAAKKNDYLIRPSHQRRESAKQAPSQGASGINEQELMAKISHLDRVLQGIIIDLYRRVGQSQQGGGVSQQTSRIADENIGTCVDISGTGLRFLTSQNLAVGDILKVMIEPPLANPSFSISALVEVKRVSKVRNPKPPHKKYAVGVRYYAMNEEDMEQITAYTFKLQRDQLQLNRQLKAR
ncbi:MAG: PilZ domain-containing protein [Nitrospinae bacterium]|nr:PilZ domain-containing protein [Nitrospinota bacterium]